MFGCRQLRAQSAVHLEPKVSLKLLPQSHHLRDRGMRLLRDKSRSNGQQTGGGRVNGVGGRGKESSGRGEGGKKKPVSDDGTSDSEEEKVENLSGRELRRQSSSGNVKNEALKRQLVVKVCRSESQSRLSNCSGRRISKVLNSNKPSKEMMESSLRKERRLEVTKRPLKSSHVEFRRLDGDDDDDTSVDTYIQEEEEGKEEEKDGKGNEKEKKTGQGKMSRVALRDLSVALTDIGEYTESKAQGQQTQHGKETDKEKYRGAVSGGKPVPHREKQWKIHSTEVNHPIMSVDSDDAEVIINSDEDDDDCHEDDDDDDDVICVSSSAQNPSSTLRSHTNGLHRWTSWNKSRPLERSKAPAHYSRIQPMGESTLPQSLSQISPQSLSHMPAVDILGIISKLQESLTEMKSSYETKLHEKVSEMSHGERIPILISP